MRRSIVQWVRDKRAAQQPLAPAEAAAEAAIGSKGWYTRGYLPHFDKPGTIQMITFRLADAMPAGRRHEWEGLLSLPDRNERRRQMERYLDLGYGSCLLRNPPVARAVEATLLRLDQQRYRLAGWVIMPNHVHVLVELWDKPLGGLIKEWKGISARAINTIVNSRGSIWQVDYWDRYVRDEEHFRSALRYVEWNPVKARLVRLPEQWLFGSAHPKWVWTGRNAAAARTLLSAHA